MNNCSGSRLAKQLFAILLICLATSIAFSQEENQQSSPLQVLPFPTNRSVGVLEVFPQSTVDDLDTNTSDQLPALGDVPIPSGAFVSLTVGAVDNLSFLEKLAPNSIHRLLIRGLVIDKPALQQISRFGEIQELRIDNCQISDDAFDDAAELKKLQKLTVSTRPATNDHSLSLAGWVARLPKIQYLYAVPSLDAVSIQSMHGQETLESINLTIDKDKHTIALKMLSGFPALRNLIVDVDESVSPRALDRLASVANLELLTLVNAHVDGELLNHLATPGSLRHLRLLMITPGEDFHDGLFAHQDLERIIVSTTLWREPDRELAFLDQLTKTLFQLPKLKELPHLNNVSDESFKQILELRNLEVLDIDRFARGFDSRLLLRLGELKHLTKLSLSFANLKDDDLKELGTLNNLQELSLVHTKVRGTGLAHLSDLPNLWRLQIMVDRHDIEPELSGLQALPHLSRFQLFGLGFRPEDFYPVAKCESLRHLTMSNGDLDDSVVQRISQLPNLRRVGLSKANLTDASLHSLAQISNLESLSLQGDFSHQGISQLSTLKKLSRIYITSSSLSAEEAAELPKSFPAASNIGFRVDNSSP